MNYSELSRSILRALRGTKSQTWLSDKLGYSFNKISRFETGQKRISFIEFYNICSALNIDLNEALHLTGLLFESDLNNTPKLMQALAPSSYKEISNILDVSEGTARRLKIGESKLMLDHFLALLDKHRNILLLFTSLITDPSQIPLMKDQFQ
jgi:transcriptional regulator with XRE-family HTH domain